MIKYQVQSCIMVCLVTVSQQYRRIDVFQNGEGRRKGGKEGRKEEGREWGGREEEREERKEEERRKIKVKCLPKVQ